MLRLLNVFDRINALPNKELTVPTRILCTNEKAYAGTYYLLILRILTLLKNDKNLFKFLVKALNNNNPPLDDSILDLLAYDFVFMFFQNPVWVERSVAVMLGHFRELVQDMLEDILGAEEFLIFDEEGLLVNRLVKAFLNMADNREYLMQLFGKLFHEAFDLTKYLETLRNKEAKEPSAVGAEPLSPEDLSSQETNLRLSYQLSFAGKLSIDQPLEEMKAYSNELSEADVMLACDGILARIVKKLPSMPLPMRYFCKMLEEVATKLVPLDLP
eukprot:TRINITY_DN17662_c0_g1_i1.p1 TRINITY_DN17662_c0_g1~~TRINITY_DN17662_c0_g1_i1.p1  ORF type:complete len:272 (-),score=50.09 TRINITY_DN17662_c0_g1_i1:170-985(-)